MDYEKDFFFFGILKMHINLFHLTHQLNPNVTICFKSYINSSSLQIRYFQILKLKYWCYTWESKNDSWSFETARRSTGEVNWSDSCIDFSAEELSRPSASFCVNCSRGRKQASITLLYVSPVSSKNAARRHVSTLFSHTIQRSR